MPRTTTLLLAVLLGLCACTGANPPATKTGAIAADAAPADTPADTTADAAILADTPAATAADIAPPADTAADAAPDLAAACTATTLFETTYSAGKLNLPGALLALPDGFALSGVLEDQMGLLRTDLYGKVLWQQLYGAAASESAMPLVQLADGFAFAATRSTAAGKADFWLARTDAGGKLLWQQTYGGADLETLSALVALPDGFALAGQTLSKGAGQGDFWLVRTDLDGKLLWDQRYGTETYEAALALVALPDGFAMAGVRKNAANTSSDAWLVRTDPLGQVLWQELFHNDIASSASALVAVPDGFVFGGIEWALGGSKLWLVRTDAAGKSQWQKNYDGGSDGSGAQILNVIADAEGFVFTAGKYGNAAWLGRADSAGKLAWLQKGVGSVNVSFGLPRVPLAATADGYAYAGFAQAAGADGYDIWLRRTDFWGNASCAASGACAGKPASACVKCAKGICK